jgi:hypothetical protein
MSRKELTLKYVLLFPSILISLGIISSANAQCREGAPGLKLEVEGDLVTDTKTGLVWKRCAEGMAGKLCREGNLKKLSWKGALKYAEKHSFAGHDDWRLPNVKELSSIVEWKCFEPAADPALFPMPTQLVLWSSSPDIRNPGDAWMVDFKYGARKTQKGYSTNAVRLVRGGF